MPDSNAGKWALHAKNEGPCTRLLGKQMIIFIFVSTPKAIWSENAISDFFNVHANKTVTNLQRQAAKYGRSLQLQLRYFHQTLDHEVKATDYALFSEVFQKQFHNEDLPHLCEYYTQHFGIDGVGFALVLREGGRSFARSCHTEQAFRNEHVVLRIGRDASNVENTIMHELLHLYGAIDLYYPEKVAQAAATYYPNSVMYNPAHAEVDGLTAYLIGWTDKTDQYSQYFIDLIEWIGPYDPPKIN